jgi:hypothetical protein
MALPPVAFPGTPETDQFIKSLSDVLGQILPGKVQIPGYGSPHTDQYDDECEASWDKERAACSDIDASTEEGASEKRACYTNAFKRYSECLRGGMGNVQTPFWWTK